MLEKRIGIAYEILNKIRIIASIRYLGYKNIIRFAKGSDKRL
jgi:hypothetical protein